MDAFQLLSRTEGIVPAIESAHALAGALTLGPRLSPTGETGELPLILVNLSGRGDKDVDTAISWFGLNTTGTAWESSGAPTGEPER
jgi:tryptophan synthase beta chain